MIHYFKTDENGRMERLDAYESHCWVDMINPSDDEVEDVMALTGVAEELLKAALDEEEPARIERDDEAFMCLADAPVIRETEDGDSYETIPMAVIYNQECVITVSLRGNPVLGGFISNRIKVNTKDPIDFLLAFMMGNAKSFLSDLRQIDKKSLRVQAELRRTMRNKDLMQLLSLENSLVYFSTSLNATYNVYYKVGRLSVITSDEEYRERFDDILIEAKQAVEMCTTYCDILSGTMDAFSSVISNNVNNVMKLLTVITIIITIPTLVASLWGMNVPMPFGEHPWGFWIVIAIAVVLTVVTSVWLIRSANSAGIEKTRQTRQNKHKHNERRR